MAACVFFNTGGPALPTCSVFTIIKCGNNNIRYMIKRDRAGYTLIEMLVVCTILGILISYGVPQFQKSFELSRIDMATAHLESVWTAERIYKAQNGAFANSISLLQNYLDASFATSSCTSSSCSSSSSCDFCFSIASASDTAFTANATRNTAKTKRWGGTIDITESGTVSGYIQAPQTGNASIILYPSQP